MLLLKSRIAKNNKQKRGKIMNMHSLLILSAAEKLELICSYMQEDDSEDFYVQYLRSKSGFYIGIDTLAYGPFETHSDAIKLFCELLCKERKKHFSLQREIQKICDMIEE